MSAYRVFLGIGSNLGDRHAYLQQAVSALAGVPGTRVVWTSSVYETEPYGKTDQPQFLNACLELETTLAPPALFGHLKTLESRLGRSTAERWGPREIDIDILVYDGLVYEDAELIVPHPEIELRRFVLIPLREIAADLVHPVSGLTVTELAAACRDTGRVVKSPHHLLV